MVTHSVRFVDLAHAEIPAELKVKLVAQMLEWTAIAMSFSIIHRDMAAQKLVQVGCPIRIDDDGEPVIWYEDGEAVMGEDWNENWKPGDPCGMCGSPDTFVNDDGVAECHTCHATDADE